MARAKGYSLWLMPSGDVYDKLASLIARLSGKYCSPCFEPHVTLIGELAGVEERIASRTSELASVIKPLQIKLTRADYLDEYFKCVFIKVEEADEIMQANLEARKIFNRKMDPKYSPHLSLMYGNFPAEMKEEIIAEVGKRLDLSFEAGSIHLFSTRGEPGDWYRVKEFALKRPA